MTTPLFVPVQEQVETVGPFEIASVVDRMIVVVVLVYLVIVEQRLRNPGDRGLE